MRRAARVDANQEAIVAGLRKAGCSVHILSRVGEGCPDILVGRAGRNWLMEIKSPRGKRTIDQEDWFRAWKGQSTIVRSIEEALDIIGRKS